METFVAGSIVGFVALLFAAMALVPDLLLGGISTPSVWVDEEEDDRIISIEPVPFDRERPVARLEQPWSAQDVL